MIISSPAKKMKTEEMKKKKEKGKKGSNIKCGRIQLVGGAQLLPEINLEKGFNPHG